jgi:hypothetical protein
VGKLAQYQLWLVDEENYLAGEKCHDRSKIAIGVVKGAVYEAHSRYFC